MNRLITGYLAYQLAAIRVCDIAIHAGKCERASACCKYPSVAISRGVYKVLRSWHAWIYDIGVCFSRLSRNQTPVMVRVKNASGMVYYGVAVLFVWTLYLTWRTSTWYVWSSEPWVWERTYRPSRLLHVCTTPPLDVRSFRSLGDVTWNRDNAMKIKYSGDDYLPLDLKMWSLLTGAFGHWWDERVSLKDSSDMVVVINNSQFIVSCRPSYPTILSERNNC